MRSRFLLFAFVLLVSLTGCAGSQSVRNGVVTDVITNVEPRASGFTILWVRTDTTSAYCTNDSQLIANAQQYREFALFVSIQYKTIDFGAQGGSVLGIGGCDPEMAGVRTYWIEGLRLANVETTRRPPFLDQ
jgi:hypothetical protein